MKPDDLGAFKDLERIAEDSRVEFMAGIAAGLFLVLCIFGSLWL